LLTRRRKQASLILNRWMNQVASLDQTNEIVLSYSGCIFTTEAASQLARFTSLDLVSSHVAAVECSLHPSQASRSSTVDLV
jgi:hypothetical protein